MDTFLTLVIALGGIATGIGAIWAAMLARRQARLTERSVSEQRQFLKEQNEIARSQAQLTEQSLAQTERSLNEQNERLRLGLEVDLLTRLQDRFESPHFSYSRSAAAKYLLDNAFVDNDVVEMEHLNNAAAEVCNFFEDVGEMLRLGVLRDVPVWNRYREWAQAYWFVCKPTIEKVREVWKKPTSYEEFEYLIRLMAEMDRERGVAPPTRERLRRIMEYEATLDEEISPTATE